MTKYNRDTDDALAATEDWSRCGDALTKTKDLKVGDVVEHPSVLCPEFLTVVTYVGGPADSHGHAGNTFVIVTDYYAATGEPTGAESDWCAPSEEEFWIVMGQRLDLAQRWADDNEDKEN